MGMYVFTEAAQQVTNYTQVIGTTYTSAPTQDGMLKPLVPPGGQDKGSDSSATKKASVEAGRSAATPLQQQPAPTSIMIAGQGFSDDAPGDDRRGEGTSGLSSNPGVTAVRRVNTAIGAANAFARYGTGGHGADGGAGVESAGQSGGTS